MIPALRIGSDNPLTTSRPSSRRRPIRRCKPLTCAVVATLASGVGPLDQSQSAGQLPTRLRVLFTTDTLGYLEPCG